MKKLYASPNAIHDMLHFRLPFRRETSVRVGQERPMNCPISSLKMQPIVFPSSSTENHHGIGNPTHSSVLISRASAASQTTNQLFEQPPKQPSTLGTLTSLSSQMDLQSLDAIKVAQVQLFTSMMTLQSTRHSSQRVPLSPALSKRNVQHFCWQSTGL